MGIIMIKNLIKNYKKSKLVRDNVIFFIANLSMGLLVFLFHFFTGRILGPAGYGVIGVILSIAYIFNIPLTTIQTGIANFTSTFKAKNKTRELNYLFKSSLRRLFIFGIICMILFVILSPLIASYLKIKVSYLIILSVFILLVFLLPVIRGVLQGLQKFKLLGLNLFSEGLSKFIIGVILVLLGFGIYGATIGIVTSFVIAFFVGYYPLRKFIGDNVKKFDTKKIYKYSIPVLLMLTGLTAFYTIDVLIVKHFFTDVTAGHYVAISTLAKILFFGSYSITQVMFPKVSELYASNKPHKHLLYKSLLMMLIFLLPITIIYSLFSSFIINLIYGKEYLEVASLLGLFAIVMSLFSLIYTIAFYNLSIKRTKFLY